MRVFFYNNEIVNVDEGCPSIQAMLDTGAEEVPVDLFGGYAHHADSGNTFKAGGAWFFSLDPEELALVELEALAESVRRERDFLLSACDWTQFADCPLSSSEVSLWAGYRQLLRDIPGQVGFPESVEWPESPSGV